MIKNSIDETIYPSILMFTAIISAKAQLTNIQWKGSIQGDETIDVVFHFSNDTLIVENIGESSMLEVLTYTAKGSLITFKNYMDRVNAILLLVSTSMQSGMTKSLLC